MMCQACHMQEEDYVTEKYGQALVAGSVPVIIGAPNIEDYAVAPKSMLVLQTQEVGHLYHSFVICTQSVAGRRSPDIKSKRQDNSAGKHARTVNTAENIAMQGNMWTRLGICKDDIGFFARP